jgi:hypothetical protein
MQIRPIRTDNGDQVAFQIPDIWRFLRCDFPCQVFERRSR